MIDNIDHLLALVTKALDDFDEVPIATAVRRAYRIARQRGDVESSLRFWLDLNPLGDAGPAGVADTAEQLWPFSDYEDRRERFRAVLDAHISARKPTRTTPAGGIETVEHMLSDPVGELERSISEMRQMRERLEAAAQLTQADELWTTVGDLIQSDRDRSQVLERIRTRTFGYLTQVEVELRLSTAVTAVFERHRHRVDTFLRDRAPAIADQMSAAIRRSAETTDVTTENFHQALLSCRRALTSLADVLYPASDEPFESATGLRSVKTGNYRNRLLAFYETRVTPTTLGDALATQLTDLAKRLEKLDDLGQKGVHVESGGVIAAEVDYAVVQTYLLMGEFLSLQDGVNVGDC